MRTVWSQKLKSIMIGLNFDFFLVCEGECISLGLNIMCESRNKWSSYVEPKKKKLLTQRWWNHYIYVRLSAALFPQYTRRHFLEYEQFTINTSDVWLSSPVLVTSSSSYTDDDLNFDTNMREMTINVVSTSWPSDSDIPSRCNWQ